MSPVPVPVGWVEVITRALARASAAATGAAIGVEGGWAEDEPLPLPMSPCAPCPCPCPCPCTAWGLPREPADRVDAPIRGGREVATVRPPVPVPVPVGRKDGGCVGGWPAPADAASHPLTSLPLPLAVEADEEDAPDQLPRLLRVLAAPPPTLPLAAPLARAAGVLKPPPAPDRGEGRAPAPT